MKILNKIILLALSIYGQQTKIGFFWINLFFYDSVVIHLKNFFPKRTSISVDIRREFQDIQKSQLQIIQLR